MRTRELVGQRAIRSTPVGPRSDRRAGFTIVEVLVAIEILAVGLLGMAGTTMLMVRQTTLADVTTGPGLASEGGPLAMRPSVSDTFEYRLISQ